MGLMPMRFTLTDEHVELLRNMWVVWQDCETGAPEIDPKRPYGNSNVARDVAETLGWIEDGGELDDDDAERAMTLHRETATALQIVLCVGRFEPGVYDRVDYHNNRVWMKSTTPDAEASNG